MEEIKDEVLTGEVEEVTTSTEEPEESGIGALGMAVAGLAIVGGALVVKTVYTGGKKLFGKVKDKIDEKKLEKASEDAEAVEAEVVETEEKVSETK